MANPSCEIATLSPNRVEQEFLDGNRLVDDDRSDCDKNEGTTVTKERLGGPVDAETHPEETQTKRPPRSERKRRRHEELLQKRKEERKRKKIERKMRLKEQRSEMDDDEERVKPRESKEERRKRCRQAMEDGQRICIDCGLEDFMSEKEKGKLAMQIGRLYGSNLRAENPVHIYLTGLKKGGQLYQECIKKMDGFENYLIDTKEEAHTELFPLDQIICLSPDSDSLLTDIDPEKVYVIGGLVDENIKQNITESRASGASIKTARLPIEENMVKIDQPSHSKVLAVNQVFDILVTFLSTKDWKQALAAGVPRRKGYVIKDDQNT